MTHSRVQEISTDFGSSQNKNWVELGIFLMMHHRKKNENRVSSILSPPSLLPIQFRKNKCKVSRNVEYLQNGA
jgi:hypothetical protein